MAVLLSEKLEAWSRHHTISRVFPGGWLLVPIDMLVQFGEGIARKYFRPVTEDKPGELYGDNFSGEPTLIIEFFRILKKYNYIVMRR